MSESARGEGGRVWVPSLNCRIPSSIPESERLYFLEEKYPAYGNLVPRDIATAKFFRFASKEKVLEATIKSIWIWHIPCGNSRSQARRDSGDLNVCWR